MPDPREILPGSTKNAAAGARLIGRTSPNEVVHVTVVLARRNAIPSKELRQHAFTRPHERPKVDHQSFARLYGASDEAIAATRLFAANYGLGVDKVDPGRRVVELQGSVFDIERAFGTELNNCALGAQIYRSRRGPLLLPTAVRPHIEAVLGLDNRPVAQPRLRPRSVGPSYYPQDLAALYQFPSGDGTGQTIALIELGGNYGAPDLTAYFAAAGLQAAPTVQTVNVAQHTPVPYGQDPDSDGEVMLDIEVAGAIAPRATIVVYFADNTDQGFYEAASQAVHDPATTVVSISWGSPEKDWAAQSMDTWNSLGQSAVLLNVPIFVAAGDHGCTDEENTATGYDAQRHADFPGTCASGVVSCGGTALQSSGGAITSETVWNDGDGWATGGGVSTHFTAPDWQQNLSAGTGLPLQMRGVPDVAGVADPNTGIKVRVNGADGVSGGTSAVAPQWAALTALLSQQIGRKPGFFLPLLYQSPAAKTTRDILSGDNSVYGVAGYSAQPGWDACTGLGSPNGASLLALLGGAAPPAGGGATVAPPGAPPAPAPVAGLPRPQAVAPYDPRAATLYGQFVVAAYSMYNADPTNRTPNPSADFPAGYELTAWIQMQDFIIASTGPTFYGFIARSSADPTAFVLAIRGTSNAVEWWDDANAAVRTAFKVPNCGSVGAGFARIYDTLEVIERATGEAAAPAAMQSLRSAGSFSRQVASLVKRHAAASASLAGASGRASLAPSGPGGASIEVTGHSLGAALATLYTIENARTDQISSPRICTFASPLVGDATFVAAFNSLALTSWRVVNQRDVVPKLPPEILGFRHVDTLQSFDSAGRVKPSLLCWHAMATYLSLIDPTNPPDTGCRLSTSTAALAPLTTPSTADIARSASIPGGPVTVNITVNVSGAQRDA
jgi:kumamolisin